MSTDTTTKFISHEIDNGYVCVNKVGTELSEFYNEDSYIVLDSSSETDGWNYMSKENKKLQLEQLFGNDEQQSTKIIIKSLFTKIKTISSNILTHTIDITKKTKELICHTA
jgi:hypothetical protein